MSDKRTQGDWGSDRMNVKVKWIDIRAVGSGSIFFFSADTYYGCFVLGNTDTANWAHNAAVAYYNNTAIKYSEGDTSIAAKDIDGTTDRQFKFASNVQPQ